MTYGQVPDLERENCSESGRMLRVWPSKSSGQIPVVVVGIASVLIIIECVTPGDVATTTWLFKIADEEEEEEDADDFQPPAKWPPSAWVWCVTDSDELESHLTIIVSQVGRDYLSESHKNQSKVHALTSATHDRQTRFGDGRSGSCAVDVESVTEFSCPLRAATWFVSLNIILSSIRNFPEAHRTTYIKEFSECDGGGVVGKQSRMSVDTVEWIENTQAKGTFQGAAGAFQSKQDTGADCDQPRAQNRESFSEVAFCLSRRNE